MVIVITGGSDGLGKETAKLLIPKHTVVILSRSEEKTKTVASELNCDHAIADVSDPIQIHEATDDILARHQRIDCLINCAGVWIEGDLETNDPLDIKKALEINILGTILATQAVIPQMKKQKSGLIINISSQSGLYAKSKRSVYNSSKWAVTGFTKSLQAELEPQGIKVTGVYPGKFKSGLFQKAGIAKNLSDAPDPAEIARGIEFILSLGKNTTVPELGIKFLGQ